MDFNYLKNENIVSDLDFIVISSQKDKKYTILAVDDEQDNLMLIKRTLHADYNVICATSGQEAIDIISQKGSDIALIISDQKMPEMEGTELLQHVEENYPNIIKILLTGHSNIDILVDSINECHLFQYILKPYEPEQLSMVVNSAIKKYEMFYSKALILQDLSELFYKTIKSFAQALDAKDEYTHGHSMRVTLYSLALAKHLNLTDDLLEEIETTGLLHDIGKIAIPEKILLKPGKLTDEEFAVIKMHPDLGKKLIEGIKRLNIISKWLQYHHERYDGHGYPSGLSGEQIPVCSRIIAIADTYDAMTSTRSYRKALSHDEAIAEITRCSGTQFDPKLAELFISIKDEILELKSNPDDYYKKYSYLDKFMNTIAIKNNVAVSIA